MTGFIPRYSDCGRTAVGLFSGSIRAPWRLANQSVEEHLGRRFAALDAVWDADPAVGVAGQEQRAQLLPVRLDALQTCKMADVILRHGERPACDAHERRLR